VILKRTKSLRQPSKAMEWVKDYLDEVGKHKGQDVSQLGFGIGKKYHCSRPPGLLTAHGYIRRQVDEIRQQTSFEMGNASGAMENNRAVQEFVRRHCRSQREKGRKIIALRLIASLDPDKVEAMVRYPVDQDRILVSAIEGTLSKVATKFYPGDELGYVVGIHHDALDRFGRPNLHGHVFLLPQTRNGLRISMSNHTCPGRDGKFARVLSESREQFCEIASNLLDATAPARYRGFASQEWDDLAKEISMKTAETVAAGRRMTPEKTRQYAINTFMFYIKKTNAAWLRRRLDQLKERIKQLSEAKRENLISELDFIYDGIERRIAGTGFEERRQIIHSILPQFERERVRCETRDCRMDVTRTCLVRWKTVGNRRGLIERLMQEVDDRRMASRISMLAEMALMDLHFAAAGLAPNLPGWIQRLERCADNDRLPNEGMVDRKELETAVEVPLPEMEVPAPDPHAPTPVQSAATPAKEPPLLPPGPAVS
jgi:hypothetical protein